MFTWICPKCGREVPPAYTECPDCANPQAAAPIPPPPQAVMAEAPPAGFTPAGPVMPPPRRSGLPTWLLTLVFAFAFLGVGAGVYWLVGYLRGTNASAKLTPSVESPAARPGAATNPIQKYIEVSGVRFVQDAKKKPTVRFVVINHSGAAIDGLTGNVTIWGRTRKSEEEAAGTFTFSATVGPWESKDITAPLTTKLSMIELPDWQNVTTDIQITGPSAFVGSGAPR